MGLVAGVVATAVLIAAAVSVWDFLSDNRHRYDWRTGSTIEWDDGDE